jgi:hypothetical protein
MPEGRRWSPENPSPAMKSFAAYIRNQGYDDSADLETTVAATFVFHRDWQQGHASEIAQEREATKAQREQEKAAKAQEREQKKAEREAEKERKAQEKEAKRQEREAAKAAKEAEKQVDGDDSDSEPVQTRKRLKTKAPDEQVAASAASF